jgi:ppGpp synthetase/RelA/SpoT-type nucleotidyltranferase
MAERTVEDRLREEYFVLLAEARRVLEELEAEVRYCLLPLLRVLEKYEQVVVTSRIKDCESALGALRRRQEGATFDSDRGDSYSLADLNDLAGVRVLAFPRSRWEQANDALRSRFPSWKEDPIYADKEKKELLAYKYHGSCTASTKIRGEVQIVPMLIGLYWEVEHAAIYKPSPQLKGLMRLEEMQQRDSDVLKALMAFDQEFERLVQRDPLKDRTGS